MMFVSNLRGHRNLETMGFYTRFPPTRPAVDFPDLTAYLSGHSKGRAEKLGLGALTRTIHQQMMPPLVLMGLLLSRHIPPYIRLVHSITIMYVVAEAFESDVRNG